MAFDRIRNQIATAIAPKQTNSMGTELSRAFIRGKGKGFINQDWAQVAMSDRDMYKGYSYSAINNKANRVALLAATHLATDALPSVVQAAKENQEEIRHPYLDIIDNSLTFDDYMFWYKVSTYLDLEGVFYLMVLRNKAGNRIGQIQEFKLLNPWNVRRVKNTATGEIGGYVEGKEGLIREIPTHMIIEMRKMNPFDDNEPFAVADAMRDSQFTLNQQGDHTRHALHNNKGAPGIITTDVELPPDRFKNFKARIENHEKGAPIFANGEGKVTWQDMQIDLNKAALRDINDVSVEGVIAATGNSKTMMGIEVSGVTRDSSKAQMDLYVENQAIPQIQLIIGALNLDYQRFYPNEYAQNKFKLKINNPLGKDRDAEQKDVTIKKQKLDLYTSLVNKGYEPEQAAKFVEGSIDLMDLGEPTREPLVLPNGQLPGQPPVPQNNTYITIDKNTPALNSADKHDHSHEVDEANHFIDAVQNAFDSDSQGIIQTQQGTLQNAVANIEGRLVAQVIQNVSKKVKNDFEDSSDILTNEQRDEHERELAVALAAFYLVIFPLWGNTILRRRESEFQKSATFKINNDVKKYISEAAGRASESHINTIVAELLEEVRERALQGESLQQIVSAVTKKYSDISKNRAMLIARTETNRAFTMSQFEADKQFITQNDLQGRAYKRWITTSANACRLCQAEAARGPVPFDNAFRNLGDVVQVVYEENGKTKVLKQVINYETLYAGNMHPNCGCKYQLIIEN